LERIWQVGLSTRTWLILTYDYETDSLPPGGGRGRGWGLNLEYHYQHVNWEEKQKLLKILFPDKLIFKNGRYINPSKDGIALLVEDIKEFEKGSAVRQTGKHDMKVVKKLGKVG